MCKIYDEKKYNIAKEIYKEMWQEVLHIKFMKLQIKNKTQTVFWKIQEH